VLTRATGVLRLAVERCADEDAVSCPEDRHDVRRALTKTARTLAAAVVALTPADTIVARLAALEHPPAASVTARAQTVAMIAAPVVIGLAGAASLALSRHHVLLGLVSVCLP